MRHEININRRSKDELQRAVPTSARYAAALVAAMLGASAPLPVLSQGVELVVVDVHAVADGYRASKLIGSSIVNDQNEKVGTIEDIIIGRDRVLFAVLQVGGFLHLGGRMVAVPYQSLVLDESGSKIKLPGATQEALKNLPEFKYAG
jgi:sporulation protein YlmC with PRC-barrel domain